MIKLQIVGNLGKDCIVKEVNGKNVINFSVVHNEKYKDSQGVLKERTTWVECAYWTDRTAVAPYLKKGQLVYAEGSPEAEAYTNKENQPAATLRMRVQSVQLLGGSNRENSGQQNAGTNTNTAFTPRPAEMPNATAVSEASAVADDLPF